MVSDHLNPELPSGIELDGKPAEGELASKMLQAVKEAGIVKTGPMAFGVDDKGQWIPLGYTEAGTPPLMGPGATTSSYTDGTYTLTTSSNDATVYYNLPPTGAIFPSLASAASPPSTAIPPSKVTEHQKKYPQFFKLAKNLERAVVNFKGKKKVKESDGTRYGDANEIIDGDPELAAATGVCSRIHAKHHMPGLHKVVLDIDHEAALVPSSTPGHYHLLIEKYLTWDAYKEVLEVLGKHGVIEKGYAQASIARGASWIRTPWETKDPFIAGPGLPPEQLKFALEEADKSIKAMLAKKEAEFVKKEAEHAKSAGPPALGPSTLLPKEVLAHYKHAMTPEKFKEVCDIHGYVYNDDEEKLTPEEVKILDGAAFILTPEQEESAMIESVKEAINKINPKGNTDDNSQD
jgi:hypothetical protein